jgi:hypothetical protein
MKEYIKLIAMNRLYVIVYFKDKNLTIRHRENGLPARLWNDGGKCYYKNGKMYNVEDKRKNS